MIHLRKWREWFLISISSGILEVLVVQFTDYKGTALLKKIMHILIING